MQDAAEADTASFGTYTVLIRERRLLRGGSEVPLGDRAFDLLLALMDSTGRPVTKEALMQRVWQGREVGENALQAQITALRRALAGDRNLVVTVSGRGYQFGASVHYGRRTPSAAVLPPPLAANASQLYGREPDLAVMADLLQRERLATLVGAVGVGKSRLAHELLNRIEAQLPRPALRVPLADRESEAAAAQLLDGALPAAGTGLEQWVLIDGCERWVQLVAARVEALLRGPGEFRFLVTSLEALRTEGEVVRRLAPLPIPEADPQSSEAIRMFFDRMASAGAPAARDAPALAAAATICRALDGLPWAIEMAAARAARVGLAWLVENLDDAWQWLGNPVRTSSARQRSWQAAMEASYGQLSSDQQRAAAAMARFPGAFTVSEATGALVAAGLSETTALDCVMELADKSLLEPWPSMHRVERVTRYRMLGLTRAWAAGLPHAQG